WKNALFANAVSFNYPVVGDYVDGNSTLAIGSDTLNGKQQVFTTLPAMNADSNSVSDPVGDSVSEMTSDTALVGYINITLNVAALRTDWVQSNLWLWLMTTSLAIVWALFILRKLNWPSKDIAALTEVCDIMLKNPELEQLPAIPQRFKFEELVQIKQAFITLFNRLQASKQDYAALAVFEQQLHQKDLSLDVQLHNFQSMITHELKTSLNAIVG